MLLLTVLVGSALQLKAQSVTSGDIVGVVADPSGAVLPNVSVTLKSDARETRKFNLQILTVPTASRYWLLEAIQSRLPPSVFRTQ